MLIVAIINAWSEVYLFGNPVLKPARPIMSSAFQAQTCSPLPSNYEDLAAHGRRLHGQAIRQAFATLFHLPARLGARGQVLDGSAVQKA